MCKLQPQVGAVGASPAPPDPIPGPLGLHPWPGTKHGLLAPSKEASTNVFFSSGVGQASHIYGYRVRQWLVVRMPVVPTYVTDWLQRRHRSGQMRVRDGCLGYCSLEHEAFQLRMLADSPTSLKLRTTIVVLLAYNNLVTRWLLTTMT